MLRLSRWCCFLTFFLIAVNSEAQYKGDHIPGFIGLESGSQAPPGFYVGDLVYVYHTDTIKDNNGRDINLPGSLTSTADAILKNRIQFNSFDVRTSFAFIDAFVGVTLGWKLKRADITAGYNLYMPTGKFEPNATDNTGL